MKLTKEAPSLSEPSLQEPVTALPAEDMNLINQQTKKILSPEEVYTFSIRLCDNEIDRDWERFPRETLDSLAPLFVGKTGIFDHNWSASSQNARIYKTQIVQDPTRFTRSGDPYCFLKAWAYMIRTPSNQELITEIDAGIKKEVSIGCGIQHAVCSICGLDFDQCHHVKGQSYDGKLCWVDLVSVLDAYEWSFVAVPAQPNAGVLKQLSPSLLSVAKQHPSLQTELQRLQQDASIGRKYQAKLREDVSRLIALDQPDLHPAILRSVVQKLDESELSALQSVLERRLQKSWPNGPQLPNLKHPPYSSPESSTCPESDDAFLI